MNKNNRLLFGGVLLFCTLPIMSKTYYIRRLFNNLLAELKNRLKISIFLWRKSCASR